MGHFIFEKLLRGFRIVKALAAAAHEAQGMLAQRAGAHSRAGEIGRAFVEGNAHDRDGGIELVKVGADG